MVRSGLPALALIALLSACSDGAPLRAPSSSEVASPAGPEASEPFLSASGSEGTVYLSWLERVGAGQHELRASSFAGSSWSEPTAVVRSDRILSNWADFPSVVAGRDGSLWAHWLERGEEGGYAVRIARSSDGGASWSPPWTPHEDESPTEHGFVAAIPSENGMGFAWLDGRAFASAGAPERAETALYFRLMDAGGPAGPESVMDPRACDCCQTDAAMTALGPVLVYRDRSPEEIRDIQVTRLSGGTWSEPQPVHADGWETGACPVNGPAVDAGRERVVVAWFTAAKDVARVNIAFSDDSATRFEEPVVVDDGDPAGRVDVVLLEDGSALVSWLERTEGEWSEVRVRRVGPGGRASASERVSAASGQRVGGFPRMARVSPDSVLIAWTDVTETLPRVRVAVIEVAPDGGSR